MTTNIPVYEIDLGVATSVASTTRQLEPGVHVFDHPQDGRPAIFLGEEGRGRVLEIVSLPKDVEVVKLGDGQEGVTHLPAPAVMPDAVALLVIRDLSGYRGEWTFRPGLTHPCAVDPDVPADLDFQKVGESCAVCGVSETAFFIVSDTPVNDLDGVAVVCRGWCAQGIAGRVGGGPEYLLAARPTTIWIRRRGRLYGAPRVLKITVTEAGEVVVSDAIAELRQADVAKKTGW